MKASILLIDDDAAIAKLVQTGLRQADYKIKHAEDGDSAFAYLRKEPVDLILMDVEMPGISGFNLLELLKKEPKTASIPVIMLTVRAEVDYKVRGLTTGADDYLVKPFATKELVARIEALLRRVHQKSGAHNALEAGGIRIDFDGHEVTAKGRKITLTIGEFELLATLMKRPGFVFSYQALVDALPGDKLLTSENIYNHVKNIRKKLGQIGDQIETVFGIGYKFASK